MKKEFEKIEIEIVKDLEVIISCNSSGDPLEPDWMSVSGYSVF